MLGAGLGNPQGWPGGAEGLAGGRMGEWSGLHHKVSTGVLFQRPGRGVWALTGRSPHKSPDLCCSRLLAARLPVPCLFICESQVGVWLLVLPVSMCPDPTW